MPRRLRATPEVVWQIDSVSVRARDGPKRLERAYRILVEGGATAHQDPLHGEDQSDARGDLCQGVHRTTRASADDRQPARRPPQLGHGQWP